MPPYDAAHVPLTTTMALNALITASGISTGRSKFPPVLADVIARTWDLGFTAFGGPPVHFQILHRRFVDERAGRAPWIDEQTYQELFAVSQALPGPASTKLVFCITLAHAGLLPALLVFVLWSLPGALGMYGLALGVQRIGETLPAPAYALLSGLNAATVGIVALAAVQLARKAITDKLTRVIVCLAGGAGLCYNALWYFPALMAVAGIATVAWDCWGIERARAFRAQLARRRPRGEASEVEENRQESISVGSMGGLDSSVQRRHGESVDSTGTPDETNTSQENIAPPAPVDHHCGISVAIGVALIVAFFSSFAALMTVRGVVTPVPLALGLFNNMYLAGTIIFGGGPVVIPLLRSYVVDPGWVSPRDFLLGLALIQAFPGPNFNFAVYLGGLTLARTSTTLGAVLGYVGIFVPGITLAVGFHSVWKVVRKNRGMASMLRGVNAAAAGTSNHSTSVKVDEATTSHHGSVARLLPELISGVR